MRTVAVILLNWNGWRDTIACLASLALVRVPSGYAAKFFVVDNGSTDESVVELNACNARQPVHARFQLLQTGANLGFAGGNNVGIRRALQDDAEYVVLLNNDTVVDPEFLDLLLAAAETDPKIGLLNPKILRASRDQNRRGGENPDSVLWSVGCRLTLWRARGTHVGYGEIDTGQYDTPAVRETAYATGCCVLVRCATVRDIGLLPEAYFLYYEDVEWSVRAQRRGWRCVVVPAARIWHHGAASSREHSASYIRYHVRNALLFVRRNGTVVQIVFVYAFSAARVVWQGMKWLCISSARPWAAAIFSGILDAWQGRTGKI